MKKQLLLILLFTGCICTYAQQLKLKKQKPNALGGKEFANSIIDTNLNLSDREQIIYNEIKHGNIPSFQRQFIPITINKIIKGNKYTFTFWVSPDYLAIGNNNDYFYMPTTPILAQKIANLTHTILPTKLMVDLIYQNAKLKLEPQPIPPSAAMTTVAAFMSHNQLISEQKLQIKTNHNLGDLTAGNKKDIIVSNKIYGQPTPRVVIYGWHKLDGKAIQPVYNKHTNTWADYSHGIRLISDTGTLNGKRIKLAKILNHPVLYELISDEGVISNTKYPIN